MAEQEVKYEVQTEKRVGRKLIEIAEKSVMDGKAKDLRQQTIEVYYDHQGPDIE